MLTGEDARFVPLLTLLEGSRTDSDISDAEAGDLVVYALGLGSDWWAERSVRWAAEGVRSDAVMAALRSAIDDARLPQPVRHQALRAVQSQG
jgi:hypothetical protein